MTRKFVPTAGGADATVVEVEVRAGEPRRSVGPGDARRHQGEGVCPHPSLQSLHAVGRDPEVRIQQQECRCTQLLRSGYPPVHPSAETQIRRRWYELPAVALGEGAESHELALFGAIVDHHHEGLRERGSERGEVGAQQGGRAIVHDDNRESIHQTTTSTPVISEYLPRS